MIQIIKVEVIQKKEGNKTRGKSIWQSGKDDRGIVYTLYISQSTLDTGFYIHIKNMLSNSYCYYINKYNIHKFHIQIFIQIISYYATGGDRISVDNSSYAQCTGTHEISGVSHASPYHYILYSIITLYQRCLSTYKKMFLFNRCDRQKLPK